MSFASPVRFVATAFLCFSFAPLSYAEDLISKGSGHNGAFLRVSKADAGGAGIIVTVELECKKNWGGSSAGAALVQMVGTKTGAYQEKIMTCQVDGGADGATKSSTERQGVFFKGETEVFATGAIEHKDKSNWQVWQNNVEDTVKQQVNGIIKASTDPKVLMEAAKSAGIAALFL